MTDYRIEAVSVNHNTSAYLELMLRSLELQEQKRRRRDDLLASFRRKDL